MNKKLNSETWVTWVVYAVYFMCTLSMTVMTIVNEWPIWTYMQLWGLALTLAIVCMHPKIKDNVKQTCLMVFAMLDIFSCSVLEDDIYPSIIVMCGCAIMISMYKNHKLLLFQLLISIGILLFHIFILKTVSFGSGSETVGFMVRVFVMLGSELYLFYFINRLNHTEEQLKASLLAAQNAENAKANFLANMSHEIRTPMNAIVGMCELILREDGLTDNIRDYSYNIQNSGRSLLAIINDILDFSKIESGKMEIIEAEFNITSTINDCINMAVTRKGSKKLEIIVHVDPEIPCGLIGDELRIRQTIINFLTNAIKFTKEGAVIVSFSQKKQEDGILLCVSVKDTGIGITKENLEKLFTSFQQVDTRKNRSVEGTGLGLAISRRLVNQMGGNVSVSSEYGVGSEFGFEIPLKVANDSPFITIDNRDNLHAVAYFNLNRFSHKTIVEEYNKLWNEISDSLKIDFRYCDSMETLKQLIASGNVTNCFVNKEDYLENTEYFDNISQETELTVIQDREDAIAVKNGIKSMCKPFYLLALASTFNHKHFINHYNVHKESTIRFSAPKARVLIVDDNVVNLKVAVGLMRPYGMQTFTAESGKEAISKLQLKDMDLVFMDHMMPEMDGVEATKIIRSMEDEYFKKLPIIALTANAVNGVRDMFLQSGFDDFMSKPIELSALDRILKSYLPNEYIMAPIESNSGKTENRQPVTHTDNLTLFDCNRGLVYAGGDEETYREILTLFVNTFPKKSACIEEFFHNQNWRNYEIDVHALKSTSKSVGAAMLSELAKELEFAAKADNSQLINEKNSELLELYKKTVEEITQFLGGNAEDEGTIPQTDSSELPEINTDELNNYTEAIISACDHFDMDLIVENTKKLFSYSYKGFVLKDEFAEVLSLADDFEYEAAANAVKTIMKRIHTVI